MLSERNEALVKRELPDLRDYLNMMGHPRLLDRLLDAARAEGGAGEGLAATEPASDAAWRVCRVIRGDCKNCPETAEVHGEECVLGCYAQAVECINTVQTGNPWRKTESVKPPWIVKAQASGSATGSQPQVVQQTGAELEPDVEGLVERLRFYGTVMAAASISKSALTPAEILTQAADALLSLSRYAKLGQACEAHGLGWYEENGEMRFQPPADVIAEQAEARAAEENVDAMFRRLVGFAPWLWADPAKDPTGADGHIQFAEARLLEPTVKAQPFTPSQYALVLRWDLLSVRHDRLRQRALVDVYKRSTAKAEARAETAERLLAEVGGALRPFAEACSRPNLLFRDKQPDDTILEISRFNVSSRERSTVSGLRIGDFRKARQALSNLEGEAGLSTEARG